MPLSGQPDRRRIVERCRLFAARMPPRAFFSHSTAALLLRAPLPIALERDPALHISMPRGSRAPHAQVILGHSLDVEPEDIQVIEGLSLTTAARTWRDLATVLTLSDLVAVGDYFINRSLPLCGRSDLEKIATASQGQRGAARMIAAAPLLDDRAESRPESKLRVLLALAGLPVARANHVIIDTETGKHMRTDLAYVKHRLVLEYQGDYHRSIRQWRKDMTRRSRLEAEGWVIMEINADDLNSPNELTARIRAMLTRQGWRPH